MICWIFNKLLSSKGKKQISDPFVGKRYTWRHLCCRRGKLVRPTCGAICASTQDARYRFDGLPPSFDARVFACRATRLTFGAQLGNIRGCFARSESPRKIVGVIIFEAFRFHERSRRICGRYRVSFVHCR